MVLTPNAKQDHRALGVIDSMARRIKTILTKTILVSKNQRWIDKIQNIINIYNNTAHMSLDGLTPAQALKPQNFNKIVRINMLKQEQSKRTSDLEVGDQVRKYVLLRKEINKPSMQPNWSETIYKVVKVQGQTITLDDGTKQKDIIYLRYIKLLKQRIEYRLKKIEYIYINVLYPSKYKN